LSCPFCVCYGIGLSINLLYVLFLLIDDPLGMIGGEIFWTIWGRTNVKLYGAKRRSCCTS